jgi:hydroxymethylpyrimidine/phosphomethylpyrimidine kinase
MPKQLYAPSANPPVILTFSTLDPSGSGGIQADIETAASIGAHCAPLITSLCTTGESPERESVSVDAGLLVEQTKAIAEAMDVKAIKLGFLGALENIDAIHSILSELPPAPIVAHPALCLWEEMDASTEEFSEAFCNLIMPLTDIAIFSQYEATSLAREADSLEACAQELLATNCESLLITGTGPQHHDARNSFFQSRSGVTHFDWQEESAASQGTSSTLATASAAYLAHGFSAIQAIEEAQHYTWQASRASRQIGFGRSTLHRFYWADSNIDQSSKPVSKSCH